MNQMKYHPKEIYYESRGNSYYIVLVYEDSKVEHVIAVQQGGGVGVQVCPNCGHSHSHTLGFGCFHVNENGDFCSCMWTREQILEARVKELEARVKELESLLMPCGHPLSAIVHSDEGTAFCRMCASES